MGPKRSARRTKVRRRRAPNALRGLCALVVVAWSSVAVSTRSQAASTFSASAGGEIVRAVVQLSPALLQEELVDPGAVTAQARLTSFGESTAFASHPYPGSLPVSAPGLIDGFLASTPEVPPELAALINLPEYPLIASSSFPGNPSSTVAFGSWNLDAQSRERESAGTTTDGANRTEARVIADTISDVVTATATTAIGAVDVGPLVQLAGIRSSATVVQAADGDLERSTEFSVASLSVLGQQLRLTANGLELAGVNLPLDLDQSVDAVEELLTALADQGTAIRLIDATETSEGVISAGLVIETTFDTGINGIIATVAMTLGRTYANVSNAARPPLGGGESPEGTSVGPGTGFGPGSDGGAVGAGGVPSATLQPAPTGASSSAPVDAFERISRLQPDTTDAGAFYAVLVAGASVLLVGVSLFRRIGVRTAWMS